jgi:hypothetical protein
MAVDKGQQLFSTMDTAADPAARLFMLSRPEIEPGSPKLNEWVRQPEALAVAFNAGLSKIMAQKESLSGDQFLSTVENLLELLHEVTGDLDDENREVLSRYVGDALIDADAETARELPGRNIERLLGGRLLRYLTEEFIRLRQDEARPIEDEAEDESLSRLLQVAEKFGLGLRDSRTLSMTSSWPTAENHRTAHRAKTAGVHGKAAGASPPIWPATTQTSAFAPPAASPTLSNAFPPASSRPWLKNCPPACLSGSKGKETFRRNTGGSASS